MIKIRYCDPSAGGHDCDLPEGIHASAKADGKHTVLCLRPGLTPAERRSAIDRLRACARVGLGPSLPLVALAVALTADRIKLTLRNLVAAARLHPTGFGIPLVLIITGVVLYGLLVTVTIHLGPPTNIAIGHLPLPVPTSTPAPGTSRPPASSAGAAGNPAPAYRLSLTAPRPSRSARGIGGAPSVRPDPPATSPGSSPPVTQPPPSPPPTSPRPSPSPSPTHDGGLCLNLLGLIGICLGS